ncbi:CoA-transferase [Escherichia coli]
MTIMVGGLWIGTPFRLVKALLRIWCSRPDIKFLMIPRLLIPGHRSAHRQWSVRKVILSHIGTNPETVRRMISGEMDIVLVPQGTLIEQIRCGGAGLGGFSPDGIGTVVEEGKQTLTDGKDTGVSNAHCAPTWR